MSKPSTARVKKHRLLNKVFGNEDESPADEVSESSAEEVLPSQERLSGQSGDRSNGFHSSNRISNSNDSQNDQGPVDMQNDALHRSSEEQSQINYDGLAGQNSSDQSRESSEVGGGVEVNNCDSSDAENSRSGQSTFSSDESIEEDPEIAVLRQWSLDSRRPEKHLDSLLCILRRRLLPQLPKSAKTFLGTTDAVYEVETIIDSKGSEGEFAYSGIEEGLRACINFDLHPDHKILLDCNVDGVELHKSSPKSLWAHQCKVFSDPDVYKPFPVSIFYCKGKPRSFHDYLKKFIIDLNHLAENGIIIAGKLLSVEIRRFICDTQARDAIKNVEGHTSSCGCRRCKVVGKKVHDVLVFLDLNCERRTPEGFRNYEDVDYYKGPSVLLALKPNLDMIYQFILDVMHLIYLGVVARMLSFLMKGAPHSPVTRLSAHQKTELDR
ncbi:hypothetical protein QAD02_010732 [Eretmocerus hayati]|uniref:Uncharacterized protein n=1 Tax=Eretmocerus hayati TaxID=131215 RepID=A0ACC2NUW0_9HYME|nr:hypothetical protein QAD02_010732 [Eretmocerus hayati]